MKRATDFLMEEHNAIERMMKILSLIADRMEKRNRVAEDILEQSLDFIMNFADKCHHIKEEKSLFPLMERRGIPSESGPIGQMLVDHTLGRRHTVELASGIDRYKKGDPAAAEKVVKSIRDYVNLLRDHIYRENNILYPMFDRLLNLEDQNDLIEEFERIEAETGQGMHEKYLSILEYLEKRLNAEGSPEFVHKENEGDHVY